MKISSKTEQPLLARTELQAIVSFEAATPSRLEVRKKIAEAVKSEESLITVTSIQTDFGQKSAKVTAHVYKTKEDLGKYVSKTVNNRNNPKEKKKEAAEAPTAPAEKKDKEQKTSKKEEKAAAPEKKEEKKEAAK